MAKLQFGKVRIFKLFETKGRNNATETYKYWVKRYTLRYSLDDITYYSYNNGKSSLIGNSDQNTLVSNELIPFTAKYIKLYPRESNG